MDLEKYRNYFNENNAFARSCGIRVTKLQSHYAEAEMTLQESFRNIVGSVHGGLIYTLADTVAGIASKTDGRATVTLDGHMNFLHAVQLSGGELHALASAQHAGGRTCVYECRVFCGDRLAATGVFTMYVLDTELEF